MCCWEILRDVAFGTAAWERLDMFDDDIDFRTKTFDVDVVGAVTVSVVGERDWLGRRALSSINLQFADGWSVDYAFAEGRVQRHFVKHVRRGGRLVDVLKFDAAPKTPPPGIDYANWVFASVMHSAFVHLIGTSVTRLAL